MLNLSFKALNQSFRFNEFRITVEIWGRSSGKYTVGPFSQAKEKGKAQTEFNVELSDEPDCTDEYNNRIRACIRDGNGRCAILIQIILITNCWYCFSLRARRVLKIRLSQNCLFFRSGKFNDLNWWICAQN